MNADSVGAYNILRLYLKSIKSSLELIPKDLSMIQRFNFDSRIGIKVSE